MSSISVVGLGKAGLPLAAVIADAGLEVLGVDVDETKVDKINSGENPLPEEPGLSELIRKHAGTNLKATTDSVQAAKDTTVHIVIVPLFIDEETKEPDFSILKKALESLREGLKKGDVVILETTVPVGTTDGFARNILEKSGLKAGTDFYLAYSPERIMTGYSISRYKEFPKLVGGINEESTGKAFEVYSKFSNAKKVSSAKTAEMAKICEGIYRDVNIGLANELCKACENYDIDFWEMREAANHQYCHIHEAGNGVGGHCIPVYPWFLINDTNLETPLMKTARDVNDSMASYFAHKVVKKLGDGRKVGVIGLTFREGVKEIAYTRSKALIKELKNRDCEVYGMDPLLSPEEIKELFGINSFENFDDMDVLVLLNKETQYKEELSKRKEKVIDTKNVLSQ